MVLALLASLPTAYLHPRLVVNRFSRGDIFAWYGTGAGGADECGQTAWLLGSNSSATRCQCDYELTFSPEENKCQSYRSEGNTSVEYRLLYAYNINYWHSQLSFYRDEYKLIISPVVYTYIRSCSW